MRTSRELIVCKERKPNIIINNNKKPHLTVLGVFGPGAGGVSVSTPGFEKKDSLNVYSPQEPGPLKQVASMVFHTTRSPPPCFCLFLFKKRRLYGSILNIRGCRSLIDREEKEAVFQREMRIGTQGFEPRLPAPSSALAPLLCGSGEVSSPRGFTSLTFK